MSLLKPNPTLPTTKQHFEILDGLRGVAAIAVVIFHFMEIAIPDSTKNFIAHGYLAVDFFFCLSGFVIAYAYDSRMEKIGVAQFLKLRFIRLHPLVVIGSVIGLIAFLFDPYSSLVAAFSAGKIALMFVASCLLIPYASVPQRYFNIFHLNPPTWSLFWEYIANIVYALVLIKLRNKALWILAFVAAILLCYESHNADYLGVGWSGDNFFGGSIRVFYSFLIGILVYRSNWLINSRVGFVSASLLLLLVFFVPFSSKTNWLVDPLIVIFYLPFLVALGAGARLAAPLRAICTFSGEISYPLYMVHYPFIWLFLSYVEKKKPGMDQLEIIIPIGVLLLIGLAYAVMVFLDIPIRSYLKASVKKGA